MKQIFLVFLVIGVFGCYAITAVNQSPFIDVKLIGVWKGEYAEQSGTLKSWTQTRNADGTYTIEFSFTEPDGTTRLSGPLVDQAALDGLLKKVRDLGMPLVSVNQVRIDETHPYPSQKEEE